VLFRSHTLVEDDLLLGTTADGAPFLSLIDASSVASVAVGESGPLGALTAIRCGARPPFSVADVGLLQEVGVQLGLAVRAANREHHREAVERVLQGSLTPTTLPQVPGLEIAALFEPADGATGVGGDFYDVYRCRDGWGMILGDVAGRGTPAAAVTGRIRQGIRLLASETTDPASILHRINKSMIFQGDDSHMVTAVAVHVQESGRRLRARIASVGHPPAVIVKADGRIRFAVGGGVPLGLFADVPPAREEVLLAPGDMMVLYSDGLIDANGPAGEPFDEPRMALSLNGQATLPVDQVVGALARAARSSAFGGHDDQAVLAFRYCPPPE